ncbi:MAG: hypothetical protein I8H98_09680 [Moraxellaceae bacterium]|nr:hypothetical protein [Moraxellaceae bacterium]
MSVSNLTYAPQLNPLVGSISTTGSKQNSLFSTSFNGQAVTGVESISGGNNTGLSITATNGPLKLLPVNANRCGTFEMDATSKVIPATGITFNSIVIISIQDVNGGTTPGVAKVTLIQGGVGFTVETLATDTGIYNYLIIDIA